MIGRGDINYSILRQSEHSSVCTNTWGSILFSLYPHVNGWTQYWPKQPHYLPGWDENHTMNLHNYLYSYYVVRHMVEIEDCW
jgi:hypothetical protein